MQWTRLRWTADDLATVENRFEQWAVADGYTNLGLMLGAPSGNLVDVDLDHPKTMRLRDLLLPPTPMSTGHAGRRLSHMWYVCTEGTLPDTRRYKMPDGSVSVELRSDRAQTLIPPSIHPSSEAYLWEGKPWGGERGPAQVDGRVLAVQVALLALANVLVDNWPERGTRHDAYLALAGGLLRHGDTVHPYWGGRNNARIVIEAVATAMFDEEGPEVRAREALGSTARRLQEGGRAVGFGRLAEIIGDDYVQQARRLIAEVEFLAGVKEETPAPRTSPLPVADPDQLKLAEETPEDTDPLALGPGRRKTSWSRVDPENYLTGRVQHLQPSILLRDDGQALMYPGRVNMLYGSSESAKSWIALQACLQVVSEGERVAYLDFEDDPKSTFDRARDLGAGIDDLRHQFGYFHPEGPNAEMERTRWGESKMSVAGAEIAKDFAEEIERLDPVLIVIDTMSVLYGLHGLDTNDTSNTVVITDWLKKWTRRGRTTVLAIDHTAKGSAKGVLPIGSQHKQAAIQGTMIQAWVNRQPIPGAVGELELWVVKDRPGAVRKISERRSQNAQLCAVVEMDSRAGDRVDMRILPPPHLTLDGDPHVDARDSQAAQRMSKKVNQEHLIRRAFDEVGQTLTINQLAKRSELTEAATRRTADRMVGLGELVQTKVKTGQRGQPAIGYVLTMRDLDSSDGDDEIDDETDDDADEGADEDAGEG